MNRRRVSQLWWHRIIIPRPAHMLNTFKFLRTRCHECRCMSPRLKKAKCLAAPWRKSNVEYFNPIGCKTRSPSATEAWSRRLSVQGCKDAQCGQRELECVHMGTHSRG